MKKVIIFVQDGVGGAERMSVLIGKNLDLEKFDVCFCLIERNSDSSIADFIPEDMRIERIPNKNPFYTMWKMVAMIIKEKPSTIFSSTINLNNKYLPFRCLFPRTKVIIRCDNYLVTYTKRQQKGIANLYPKADCIIAQTEEMRDELANVGIDENKIVVLHNPIDIQTIDNKVAVSLSPYPNNGLKHFVAVGRFNRQKGFDMLIDAFIEAYKSLKNVDLYIVGDNTLENGIIYEDIMRKAIDNNVKTLVHCVGYKDNPYVYIKYADCFVLSSRWEGLPNVMLESLYLGTPVAAFKCIPVIQRIIDNGVTGYCADKEDISSLANAMIKALKLGRVKSVYKSASIGDFVNLFE